MEFGEAAEVSKWVTWLSYHCAFYLGLYSVNIPVFYYNKFSEGSFLYIVLFFFFSLSLSHISPFPIPAWWDPIVQLPVWWHPTSVEAKAKNILWISSTTEYAFCSSLYFSRSLLCPDPPTSYYSSLALYVIYLHLCGGESKLDWIFSCLS